MGSTRYCVWVNGSSKYDQANRCDLITGNAENLLSGNRKPYRVITKYISMRKN